MATIYPLTSEFATQITVCDKFLLNLNEAFICSLLTHVTVFPIIYDYALSYRLVKLCLLHFWNYHLKFTFVKVPLKIYTTCRSKMDTEII